MIKPKTCCDRVSFLSLVFLTLILVIAQDAVAAGKRYALIVGVKKYLAAQPLPELSYTENDADGLAKVLKAGGYDVTLMTQALSRIEGNEDFAPTCTYIRDQLDALLSNPNLADDDIVIVALAGHGVQYELIEGDKKTAKFYFCPADAHVTGINTANEITARNELLDLKELYEVLNASKAGGKLLMVDACRNDPSKPSVSRSLSSATLPPLPPPPGGTAAFFSCSAHQKAFEDKDLKHGVFFHHVIEALNGDADVGNAKFPADNVITLSELSGNVSGTTYDFVRKKYHGAKQAPELKGEFRLSIPLISVSKRPYAAGPSVLAKPSPMPSSVPVARSTFAGQTAGERQELVAGMRFRWCPPPTQTFLTGSPASEKSRNSNEEQVQVTLSAGFWLGETEVTQGQWESLMHSAPWKQRPSVQEGEAFAASYIAHSGGTSEPDTALEFCRRLTEQERKAGRLPAGWKYALPTESQWEYACRAGTLTLYNYGDDVSQLGDFAWYDANGRGVGEKYAHQVGLKSANAWGLCDMHGNVGEWCADWYSEKIPGGRDPMNASPAAQRVIRGGCWHDLTSYCRSAARGGSVPSYPDSDVGFRVAGVPASK